MDDNAVKKISNITEKIKKLKLNNINEAQTKKWLIEPFFEVLGWDFSNPDEVVPEDDDTTGKRPDYCFYIDKNPKLLIEAKPLNYNLNDHKMITEKLNYCLNSGIKLLIITDGNIYKVYYSELKGVGKDKLLQDFSLLDNYDEDFVDKLSKDSFENERLLTYAKNMYLLTTIKKATEKLFTSADKRLVSLLNENVKEILGHKFGNDEIEEALKQFTLNINSDMFESPFYNGKEEDNSNKDTEPGSLWTVENQFKGGKWKASFETYRKIIDGLKNNGLKFKENPTKLYIGLISDDRDINFCQIHGQKSGLKMWLSLSSIDLSEQETLKVRDVSKIGHWGMGDFECIIDNSSDIEWVINIIKKAYFK